MYREEDVIEYLKNNKPKGANQIAEWFQWSPKMKEKNREFLEKLEEEGKVIKVKGEKYSIPEKFGYILGKLDIVENRFGFVDTAEEGIFIPKNKFKDAVSGDTVFITITKKGENSKKKEGEVVRVVKRESDTVIGIFKYSRNFGFVVPNRAMGRDIFVSRDNFNGARDEELVMVKVLNWGDEDKKPEGVVLQVLGNPYDTDVMIEALIKREGYSESFEKEVKNEVKGINVEITNEERSRRKDLTNLDIITIDGDDAKDLDDAVYVEKLPNGNYKLIVSIADVAHYVKEGTALDKEAEHRGNSVYLVDRVIPMLPRELSNGICSLNPHEERLTFSVELEIDSKGKVINDEMYRSIINSKHRMTYTNVNKIIANDEAVSAEYADIKDMVFVMKELSEIIRNKKYKRGFMDLDLPEKKVVLDERRKVKYIKSRERGESEKIIEDFMIEANEAVATKIFWLDLPSIYRTHDKPDIGRVQQLNEFIAKFGYAIHGIDELYPGKFQKIVEDAKSKGYGMIINKMILMSMKQARYTTENTGHFGLASNYYTHFTSPIRRYADLIVHRVLTEAIRGVPSKKRFDKLAEMTENSAAHISITERKAAKAEEESIDIKVVEYMLDKIGEVYDARITGMNRNGLFIETENHIECYYNIYQYRDGFTFDEKNYKLLEKKSNREYNIGDSIKVIVSRVSLKDLSIEVTPYEEENEHGRNC